MQLLTKIQETHIVKICEILQLEWFTPEQTQQRSCVIKVKQIKWKNLQLKYFDKLMTKNKPQPIKIK